MLDGFRAWDRIFRTLENSLFLSCGQNRNLVFLVSSLVLNHMTKYFYQFFFVLHSLYSFHAYLIGIMSKLTGLVAR